MNTKHLLGFGIMTGALSAVALGAGCGSSSPATTGGTGGSAGIGGATTTTTTVSTTSSHSVTVTTTSGAGGAGGGSGAGGTGGVPSDNTTAATATTVTVNGPAVSGQTPDQKTKDYYTFTATAGERLYIAANAVSLINPAPAANEDTIIDTVVTVFDSTMTKIAQDDDGYPRQNTDSAVFFEAPTTGTYYYTVDDCNAEFPSGCATIGSVTDFAYQTFVADVDMLSGKVEGSLKYSITEAYAGTAQDGTTAKAVPIAYTVAKDAAGIVAVDGDSFTTAANTHVFSFTVPSTLTPASGSRLRTELWLQPSGIANGDGSIGQVTAWITDSTGTTILAQADQVNYRDGDNFTDGPLNLSVPVTTGSAYYLFVKDDKATPVSGDYYFFLHTIDSGNPLQVAGGGNTSAATAQALSMATTAGSYFVDGNITTVGTKYWYEVDPPSGATTVFASCSSLRAGSGVQGLTMDLQAQVGAAGTPASIVPGTTVKTETATADLSIPVQTAAAGLTVAKGVTKMFLIVSATGQSATVTDTSYQCAVSYGN